MSSQSSPEDCRLYCSHDAISSYETVVSLIGWLPTLELYFPSSMKDIGLMCCVAELLVEAACIKGMGQIVTVMEDGLRLCLWHTSVFPRLLWISFTSILQFQYRAITGGRAVFLYFVSVYFFHFS